MVAMGTAAVVTGLAAVAMVEAQMGKAGVSRVEAEEARPGAAARVAAKVGAAREEMARAVAAEMVDTGERRLVDTAVGVSREAKEEARVAEAAGQAVGSTVALMVRIGR